MSSAAANALMLRSQVSDVPREALPYLPSTAALQRTVQRERRKNQPPLPATPADLVVPPNYQKTINGSP